MEYKIYKCLFLNVLGSLSIEELLRNFTLIDYAQKVEQVIYEMERGL